MLVQAIATAKYIKRGVLMENLNRSQLRFLKKLNKHSRPSCSELTESQKNICDFLESIGYITFEITSSTSKDNDSFQLSSDIDSIAITELGKSYLYWHRVGNVRWRVTTGIAIAALVVAIAAIILSPFFNAYFTKLYEL